MDTLAQGSDEGRGQTAISVGKVFNNRYTRQSPNEETLLE